MNSIKISLFCLSPRDQKLIQLYYYDGYTQAEIGDKMNTSGQYAGRMINRATKRLRAIVFEINS